MIVYLYIKNFFYGFFYFMDAGVTKFFEGEEPPENPMERQFLEEKTDIEKYGEENITSVEADHLA